MRGGRAYLILTLNALMLSVLISIIYLTYATNSGSAFGPDPRNAGKTIFAAVVLIQALIVIFISPAFTAGAISGEKERQTYDILRTTLLTARSMVSGKLVSSLSYVVLMLVTTIPLQSVGFLLGGVSLTELVIAQLLLLAGAVTYATVGLFFSSRMRSTLAASVATFATALILVAGLPLVALVAASFFGPFLFGIGSPPWTVQLALIYGGLLLSATNLPATLIISDVILVQEGALFAFNTTIDGHTVWIPSPWYLLLFAHVLLALLFFWLTVRRVQQVSDG